MALNSPGVEVSIIDQSQYLPAASSSVPLIVLATAQNKANAAGTGVAAATTATNANKLYQVTSQRDLVNLFGNPFFYKTTNGTSIHGYELNEYGLMAAYSLLGSTNRAYILRADVDLGGLVGTLSRPVGEPANGTYWLDTTNSTWGIYEFSYETGKFTNKIPTVYSDTTNLSNGYPKDTQGNIGDYAVVPLEVSSDPAGEYSYFFKTRNNEWVALGSVAWKEALITKKGVNSPTSSDLVAGNSFTISISSGSTFEIIVGDGSYDNTVDGIALQINDLGISALTAYNIDGKLAVSLAFPDNTGAKYVSFATGTTATNTNPTLDTLGIFDKNGDTGGTFYQPATFYGTSAQMPLWSSSQSQPHPTGSVWIKTSTAGTGMNIVLSKYNSTTGSFSAQDVKKYVSGYAAIADLDSAGGKNIAAGTVYAQCSDDLGTQDAPIVLWERLVTGATVITGSVSNPTVPSGKTITVYVSEPNSSSLTAYPSFTTSGPDADSFASDWSRQNILNTSISVTTDNAIQISHTLGGDILIVDFDDTGASGDVLSALGITPADVDQVTHSSLFPFVNTAAEETSTTSADGSGLIIPIISYDGQYYAGADMVNGGTLYQQGDLVTISGTQLGGTSPANDLTLLITQVNNSTGAVETAVVNSGTATIKYFTTLSNWVRLSYIANEGAPAATPLNGTTWFFSTATQADIMVNVAGEWLGYKNAGFDESGNPSPLADVGITDPLGPIMSTTAPTTQTDSSALEYGDLWINTSDLENYPVISRWERVADVDQWVLLDTSDQTSHNGVVFADARWATSGAVDPVSDPIASIPSLLVSDYLDLDAPDPALYPQGMLLFNTRRSGYNVKTFTTNYFTGTKFPSPAELPTFSYTWVSSSGLKENGAAYMGRKAQRNMVVQALKSAIGTNMSIREEDTFFNLISTPGYPELQPDMVSLNNDRNNTAYIVGDTPLRLPDQATAITNWATNTSGATATGEDGWVTRDSYLGVFYPSGITTDLTGASIVVPASHMMLRTFLRNDTVAYPWLAAAGTRRGTIDNATNIGYLDAATGEFQTIKNRMSIRDVLYTNQINPLAYFTGVGLLNYGNKNSFDSQSALDRTNVARLVAYIRDRVQVAARPFVFEPNDSLTRNQLAGVIQSLFVDLVAKRGLYDYLVVCDDTNNTPARIDRNELWVDIAIEPVKAAEFIYIPVRILNTGELQAGG